MKYKPTIVFLILSFYVFFMTIYAKCQNLPSFEDIILSKTAVSIKYQSSKSSLKNNYLLLFYKNYFSSQDGNNCSFYPSCSKFASESIQQKGWFVGSLAAFDRISRCNGHNQQWYLIHVPSQKLLDLAH
jgi:hypothetical protein